MWLRSFIKPLKYITNCTAPTQIPTICMDTSVYSCLIKQLTRNVLATLMEHSEQSDSSTGGQLSQTTTSFQNKSLLPRWWGKWVQVNAAVNVNSKSHYYSVGFRKHVAYKWLAAWAQHPTCVKLVFCQRHNKQRAISSPVTMKTKSHPLIPTFAAEVWHSLCSPQHNLHGVTYTTVQCA